MLVATPGQTTAYSTLHNSGNTTTTGPSAKKSTLNSTTTNATAASGTPKTLLSNNHNSTTTNSTSNTSNSYNHHQNNKNGNNHTTTTSSTTTSSKDPKSSTAHSLKTENSTKPTNFIQTLKDSVQKALISTTGNNSISKHSSDKLQNCNNSTTTSLQNVTSSSSNNAKTATATASSSISNNSATAASTSSSSLSLVRSKYSACSLSKLHTIAPTILHRFPEDRQHASSTDSLQKEMCHFKPISTVPTTPWKSGSKSRGNSLRFPKPNIATKKIELILKSNCDVNNRKKKQQKLIQGDLDDEDDDNEDEQENKEYHGIYKPKPSTTYLSTTVATPNRQSAFVCLVAQMKNLVNIQSKKIIASGKSVGGTLEAGAGNLEIAKTKSTRTARPVKDATTINNLTTTSTISITPNKKTKTTINVPVKELVLRQKQNAANKSLILKDLVKSSTSRSTRRTLATEKKKTQQSPNNASLTPEVEDYADVKRKSLKSDDISKISPAGLTKAKSRRKLGSAKSKTINIEQLASTVAKDKLLPTSRARGNQTVIDHYPQTQTNKRKRKINHVEDNEPILDASAIPPSNYSNSQGKARKSVRLSKDIGANSNKIFRNQATSNSNNKHIQKQRSAVCFSPPLTRARLKHLNVEQQGKISAIPTPIVEIKKRKV